MFKGTTIGICAYNEDRNIAQLLSNILKTQELPAQSEIIVVCSGCTDKTVEIAREYSNKDARIRVIVENQRRGKPSAINKILTHAKGDTLLFLSADTLPNEGCFRRLLSKLQLPNVGIVCGNPTPINSSNSLVGKLVQILWNFHSHVFQQLNDAGLARHATEIFCIRKGIVTRIPKETINDDAYIAIMTKKQGWLIKYDKQSRVSICGPQTFMDYFNQRRRILLGHNQVKRMTGEAPQHLLYMLPLHPIRVMKLFLWLFKKYGFLSVLTFTLIELMLNFISIGDSFFKKTHNLWKVSTSTKSVKV